MTPASAATLPRGAYWFTLYDIQKAWQVSKGAGVTVAVIDSGVQASNATIAPNLLPGIDLTGADPGATKDDLQGSDYGHGTDMAAKIAGTGAGGGMVGVAPDAKILPIDVATGAKFDGSEVPNGIREAVDRGAKVINLSIGGEGACTAESLSAVRYAYDHDVIVVAAAGDRPGSVITPGNCPGVIAVGGVDAALKSWANTPSGPEVDFVAPSFNLVHELVNNKLYGPYPDNDGTSTAAALTSGVFALLRSHFPKDTARQIVTRALYNVHNGLGAGRQGERVDDKYGYGMILPAFALTENPPANAKNPIYDRFAQAFGSTTPTTTPTSNNASDSTAPSTPTNPNAKSDSSDSSPTVPILIVVAVLIAAGGAIFLIYRNRTRRPTPPNGPGGYPPPPPPPGY